MKINSTLSTLFVIVCLSLSALAISAIADDSDDTGDSNSSHARDNYIAYYNKTFSIDSGWEWENVSVVVFVQTDDQTVKSDSSGGYQFESAEVLQSTVNDLDGGWVSTSTSRHVLAELFTSEFCGYCPGAVGAMDRIARDSSYYPSKMSLIEWHPNSGGYADQYGFPASDIRINWYFGGHSFGYPASIFDGAIEEIGGSSDGNNTGIDTTYKTHINARTAIVSPLDITTKGYKDSTSGWINVSVELKSGTDLKNLKVNFVIVEDIYPAMKSTAYYRYTARSILIPENFIPPNHAPYVANVVNPFKILEDTTDSSTIDLEHVFYDEDSDDLTFSSDKDGTAKEHILVTIGTDGKVTLKPDDDWNGIEDITFYADDGRVATATSHQVTVTIDPVNDAPYVDTPMQDFNLMEDTVETDKFDLTEVFKDVDMDPTLNANPQGALTFSYSGNEHITVSIESNKVTFTPESQWNGEETITFEATDPVLASVTEDVTVTVKFENDPPSLLSSIEDIEFDEDNVASEVIDLNDYFSDPDDDAITYSADANVNIDVSIVSGKVTLTPDANWYGKEIITFYATDNIADLISTDVNVTVKSANDAPVLNYTDDWEILSSNVKASDKDTIKVTEGELLNVIVTAYDPADGDTLTFSDDTDMFDIDPVTGEISYTPTNDDVGTHDIMISVGDGGTTDNLAEMTFEFIILNANDPPGTPTIISPGDGSTFTVGIAIEFEGSCDDPDLHVTDPEEALSFAWTSNLTTDALGYGTELSLDSLCVGVHEITLTVTDKAKDTSSATITITVEVDKIIDTDKDGIPDYRDEDDDNDEIPDWWEEKYNFDLFDPEDAGKDSDGDGFSNLEEFLGNDGEPGGEDYTNPRKYSSAPDIATEKESTGDGLDFSMFIILAVIAVVVIVLVALFVVMRKRKQSKEVPGPAEYEQPLGEGLEESRVPIPVQDGYYIQPPPGAPVPVMPPIMPPPMQQAPGMYDQPSQVQPPMQQTMMPAPDYTQPLPPAPPEELATEQPLTEQPPTEQPPAVDSATPQVPRIKPPRDQQ